MRGSAERWGPLFGAGAAAWAETWEGPDGWGNPAYLHVLDRTGVGPGTSVLDCGCGAGRFARMAADRGAIVAGIDAAAELVVIANERTPAGDFRTGDMEALPWRDESFDAVTGFSTFQFADDKVQALREARRVSRGTVVVVVPARAAESGLTAVFAPLSPLFEDGALESMRQSGMFALSAPEKLDEVLVRAELETREDDELECPIGFDSLESALRAFLGAGPMQLAIRNAGKSAVTEGLRTALGPFVVDDGRVGLPAWYRVVVASS